MAHEGQQEPKSKGLIISGGMHLALLALLAFGFTQAQPLTSASESISVETISASQLNEIMQGEKDAKPAPAKPTLAKPAPEAPQPPPRPDPPKETEPPPEPPRRPEPPKPEPPKPEPPKPEPPPPEPPRRPDPPKPAAEEAPSPPQRPRPEKVEETPRPPERPRPVKTEEPPKPAFRPDEIAKSLAKEKLDAKPVSKPETKPAFDPTAISKLIGQTKTAELSPKTGAQGLPNHQAARMSVSLENGLNEWFRDSYKNCWTLPPSNPTGENYVFDVRVSFNPDGSLSGRPVMLNPPRDPEWRAHADSVMRAVMRCNPLRIPTQYTPFFEQWRSKTIHFDPSSAEG